MVSNRHAVTNVNSFAEMPTPTASAEAAAFRMSAAVPLKFYQVCRLCLTVVSDTDAVQLSVFDARSQQQQPPTINNNSCTINSVASSSSSVIMRNDSKFNINAVQLGGEQDVTTSSSSTAASAALPSVIAKTANAAAASASSSPTSSRSSSSSASDNNANIAGSSNNATDSGADVDAHADAYAATELVMEHCSESQLELMQRIYTFLNIEVSTQRGRECGVQ